MHLLLPIDITEIAKLQDAYSAAEKNGASYQELVELCTPMRDEIGLLNSEILRIARNDLPLSELLSFCQKPKSSVMLDEERVRGMKGLCVWLKITRSTLFGGVKSEIEYCNFHGVLDGMAVFTVKTSTKHFSFDDYGVTWSVYRYEPKDNANLV